MIAVGMLEWKPINLDESLTRLGRQLIESYLKKKHNEKKYPKLLDQAIWETVIDQLIEDLGDEQFES